MDLEIERILKKPQNNISECVERKGLGHPDTLSDCLGELLSREYSGYTLENFGYVLHHDFDKVSILGGRSEVTYLKGRITKPITVLLNGRASTSFSGEEIPIDALLEKAAKELLFSHFVDLTEDDINIVMNVNNASSPGGIKAKRKEGPRSHWFNPRGPEDLPELKKLASNDSVITCGFYPFTVAQRICLEIERHLNSVSYKKEKPWCGSDIKLQVYTRGNKVEITICVPQLAKFITSLGDYCRNLEITKVDIINYVHNSIDDELDVNVYLNMRDNFDIPELYMTAIGSSIESGDIGVVGRGNRLNGLITPDYPMSIEAPYGKNPVYHVGKLYTIISQRVAEKIYSANGAFTKVYMMSQTGRLVRDPWKVIIKTSERKADRNQYKQIVEDELSDVSNLSKRIAEGKIELVK